MRHYDLIVLGAGSGNMLFGPETAHLSCAIVEPDRFGGTCLNRGCIPSKMFVVAADAAVGVSAAKRLGVHATLDRFDFAEVRDRVFARIDPIPQSGVDYRREQGVDVYSDAARFVSPKVLQVGSEQLTAETIVVAVGSRPVIPDVPGLDGVEYHTSDTIMRIDDAPASMVVIGGGFIAAELGHVFSAFGTQLTIVQRGPRLLMAEDEQVSARFTELAGQRHRLCLDSRVTSVERQGGGVRVHVTGPDGAQTIEASTLLLTAGRRPNTDLLDATAGGLALDEHGHIVTDEAYRTSVPGVWSLGDSTNHFQLKHMANAEVRAIRHNLFHPDDLHTVSKALVPHAVFSDPQVASIGVTEAQARERGIEYLISARDYSDTAYGWALEDTTSFAKVIVDARTRLVIGAHIIGPQAATLIQLFIQAMTLGTSIDALAHDILYIHPALTEVIEQVCLGVD